MALAPVVSADSSPDESVLADVAPVIGSAFTVGVVLAGPVLLPRRAYDEARRQYRSTVVLDELAARTQPDWLRLLGMASVDLYARDLNFVFGQADARRGVAVFSLARLGAPDRSLVVRRAATEGVHELAHTFGLRHCSEPRCVMWFSNTLADTDRKGTRFCERHARELRDAPR